MVALLYIFLFAVMKTGVGLVRGQRRDSAIWTIDVDKGPRGIRGIHVDMLGPVIVGRSPSSDICINEPFVSASHARFRCRARRSSSRTSTRLTASLVNGRQLVEPATLREGDEVQIGDVGHEGEPSMIDEENKSATMTEGTGRRQLRRPTPSGGLPHPWSRGHRVLPPFACNA